MENLKFGNVSEWSRGKKVLAVIGFLFVMIIFINTIRQSLLTTSPIQPVVSNSAPTSVVQTPASIVVDNSPAGKLCKNHPTWTLDECKELIDGKLWITNSAHLGMTYDMMVYLRGKADNTNVSDYGNGKSYQYCWDNYTPSCFYDKDDDGKMDAYN
jgi:hypothetical protein